MCAKATTWQEFYLFIPDENCDHPPHSYTLEEISKFQHDRRQAEWEDTVGRRIEMRKEVIDGKLTYITDVPAFPKPEDFQNE